MEDTFDYDKYFRGDKKTDVIRKVTTNFFGNQNR